MSDNIHEAILEIMKEVSYVQKERASSLGYTLKTENAVINAIRPAMVEHGVIMYPVGVEEIHHTNYVAGKYDNSWNRIVAVHVYRFAHAASQTHVDVRVLGDGADMGDKAGNKSMTTSKKYALLETFLLETGDDPDLTPSPKQTKPKNVTVEQSIEELGFETPRPWSAEKVKEYILRQASQHLRMKEAFLDPDHKRVGGMVGTLNDIFGGDTNRHACLSYLTGKASMNDLKDAGLLALRDWISIRKVGDEWMPGEHVKQEAQNVFKAAALEQGQKELL